ncbi:hypothetical protein WDU94_001983 [Cyamophila willieti]
MNRFLKLSVLLISVQVISCYPSQPAGTEQSSSDSTISNYIEKVTTFVKSCGDKELTSCLKMRSLTYVDKMLRKNNEIPIVDGITIVSSEDKNSLRDLNGRALSDEDFQTKSEDEIENLFMDRVARFLSTHTIQFKMPTAAVDEMKRSLDEGRGKKKKIKMLLPLLLLFKLKAAALIPLALGALALISFKALIIGKIALVLALIIGVQKLLANKAAQTQSYEVVAHPHYSEEHQHGHYAAARSMDTAQKMAYQAHQKSE